MTISASARTPAKPENVLRAGHDDRVDEQADDDRRRRQQDVVDEPRGAAEPALLPVFGEVDAGEDADRRAEQRRQRHHRERAEDGVGEAADLGLRRRRHLGEQRERQAADAEANGLDQDPDQPEDAEAHRRQGERQGNDIDALAPARGCVRRAASSGERGLGAHATRPFALLQLLQQHLRDRQDDEGDQEQHQAEVDQRGLVQARRGLAELVGQRRGDAVGGLEQRERIELVEVADDERHRHRLADGAAEAEHDAADDAGLGVRQHDLPDDLPGGRTERVGRLLQHRRRHLEDVAHHRGDERDHHDRQDDPGREQADADRRARKRAGRAAARP